MMVNDYFRSGIIDPFHVGYREVATPKAANAESAAATNEIYE